MKHYNGEIFGSQYGRYGIRIDEIDNDGGFGSGNWGHAGRKGQRGGSARGGGVHNRFGSKESGFSSKAKERVAGKKVKKSEGGNASKSISKNNFGRKGGEKILPSKEKISSITKQKIVYEKFQSGTGRYEGVIYRTECKGNQDKIKNECIKAAKEIHEYSVKNACSPKDTIGETTEGNYGNGKEYTTKIIAEDGTKYTVYTNGYSQWSDGEYYVQIGKE